MKLIIIFTLFFAVFMSAQVAPDCCIPAANINGHIYCEDAEAADADGNCGIGKCSNGYCGCVGGCRTPKEPINYDISVQPEFDPDKWNK